ncbi:hypothetical protein [Pontibacter actiniarum]|uniref:Uncharacterized protein n=1 Tax=Pontibacter actiniarum TaxID=323450 RepID=A0A1X9YUK0_9BACT|nr:hypothetical protein [Pontibacter actiniarum]ARS36565.1 hypothetical protein CA264_14675 [Pontibacter actiniarum]
MEQTPLQWVLITYDRRKRELYLKSRKNNPLQLQAVAGFPVLFGGVRLRAGESLLLLHPGSAGTGEKGGR